MFTLALGWLVLYFAWLAAGYLEWNGDIPVSLVYGLCLVPSGLVTLLLCRRWTGFLVVPPSIPVSAAAARLLQAFLAVIIIVPGLAGLLQWRFDPGPSAPDPQAGMEIAFAIFFAGLFIAPVVTVVLAGWLLQRAGRKTRRRTAR